MRKGRSQTDPTAKDRSASGREDATGKKSRGRKPKSPEDAGNKDAKANVTDPDSRIMKTRKGYVQGLNAQAAVTEDQVIVAEDVTQQENDKQQLHPMLDQAEANRQAVGVKETMGTALADAGYSSDDNFRKVPAGDAQLLIATQKDWKQRKAMQDRPPRSRTVEPVFGQIKDVRGFDRFMRRGFEACRSEWSLICATDNLLKLWRIGKACWS